LGRDTLSEREVSLLVEPRHGPCRIMQLADKARGANAAGEESDADRAPERLAQSLHVCVQRFRSQA